MSSPSHRSVEQPITSKGMASSIVDRRASPSEKAKPKLTVKIPEKEWPGTWYLPKVAKAPSVDDATSSAGPHVSFVTVDLSEESSPHSPLYKVDGCQTCLERGDSGWVSPDYESLNLDPKKFQSDNVTLKLVTGPRPPSPESISNMDPELFRAAQREFWQWHLQNSSDMPASFCDCNTELWPSDPSAVPQGLHLKESSYADTPPPSAGSSTYSDVSACNKEFLSKLRRGVSPRRLSKAHQT